MGADKDGKSASSTGQVDRKGSAKAVSKEDRKAQRKEQRKVERKAGRKANRKAAQKAERVAVVADARRMQDVSSASTTTTSDAAAASQVSCSPELDANKYFGSFSATPFGPSVLQMLSNAGYSTPTAIQSQAWPVLLEGQDLIAIAKTGSGKTLAFLLPMMHRLSQKPAPLTLDKLPAPRALVISPTRELASQIFAECQKFGACLKLTSGLVYGGMPISAQRRALVSEPPAVLVATPGRLVDLQSQRALTLARCEAVTLDEADRLLDMGFEAQINSVFGEVPPSRQTLLFSATWPKAVRKLAAAYLRAGVATTQINVGGGDDVQLSANTAISQAFIHATDDEKDAKLYKYLCELEEGSRVIVFANTKRRVEKLSKDFSEFGTCAIHGDKRQDEREGALRSFIANECPLMVATDVAARGLDIGGVTHVINFDMARDVESYVHRIGRTGRAGKLGTSLTFWNPDYDKQCAPALVKIALDAKQYVPEWLAKFQTTKASKLWDVSKAQEVAQSILKAA